MKNVNHNWAFLATAVLLVMILVLSACSASTAKVNPGPTQSASTAATPADNLKGTITVSGAFAIYPIMVKWGEEFSKIHPGVKVEVSAGGAGKGMADALGGLVDIGMISREIQPAEIDKGAVFVAATIDAVVPTINTGNPVKDDILTKGITNQQFIDIWITGKTTNWKDIFPNSKAFGKTDLHVLTRSDASGAADVWALYLGKKKQEDLLGIGVYGDPGLAETVKKDPLAIGFNNIGYAYDAKTRKPIDGILVTPIDINSNGRIDPEENFYSSLDDLTKAIANKAYPWPPARQEYLATLKEFKGVTKEFVKWILTDGQKYAPEAGYIQLPAETVQKQLEKIK